MKRGWLIVLAGIATNLCFGVLYSWSVFAGNLRSIYGWSSAEASLPYTIAILMFAVLMIPGGRLQDKMGPRFAVVLAGTLIGSGLLLASFMTSVVGLAVAFGVLGGSGIGIGYSATTPCAVKWFPPQKKGLISGLVVGGFGLAPLYIAPLTTTLIESVGISGTFRTLGISFAVVVILFGLTLRNPEKPVAAATPAGGAAAPVSNDYTWQEMIKTTQFKQLWIMFFVGALAGLMIIGHLATIVNQQSGGLVLGAGVVAIASITNALGRPAAGVISDKIGRAKTMMVLYIAQGLVLIFYSTFTTYLPLLLGACIITFGYGAMLAVYPSAAGDFYGSKNLGLNYGVLFSAWGVGGIVGPQLAGLFLDATGTYQTAFYVSAALCFLGAFVGYILKPVKHA